MKPETSLKAQLYIEAIRQITGESPVLSEQGEQIRISFTPSQQIFLRTWLKKQLEPGKSPPDIEIDTLPVLAPVAVEKLWPYALGLVALGFIAARVTR